MDVQAYIEKGKSKYNENQSFLKQLKNKKPNDLDKVVKQFHEEVFEYIDCLECANCCKTIGPRLYMTDIERLSKNLKMKSGDFVENYLELDDDGDYGFKEAPCPFLGADNYCAVYKDRPKACREYPHTDRKRFHQILNITLKNTIVCPAVYEVIEKLKTYYLSQSR
jgi:Fe-S-cluster containining protein